MNSMLLLIAFPMTILLGWLLDLVLGDPVSLPHPIVYFGKWISFWEKRLNKGNHRLRKGAVFAVFSIALVYGMAELLMYLLSFNLWLSIVVGAVLVFYCLAGKTLRSEVRMVFEAVDRSLEEGRKQVARIVGRDTSELSAQEVRTAALETLAENLSDGVIAPLFWLLLLGVPGMLTYKMINTLDSMIGYQNARYKDFGCWAAHIDDIANYIPARITAFLLVFVGWIYGVVCRVKMMSLWKMLKFVVKFGPQHASPNSGWPEAALASILDCQFGGPHNYFGELFYKPYIGVNPKQFTTEDMRISIRVCLIAECLLVVGMVMLML